MNHQPLRLTPANSPFFKNTIPRSPTKPRSEEAGLRLQKIIGTTTASVNGFDCLPSGRQFAYCAGSAAVVATVDQDLNVNQRFFRARPASSSTSKDGAGALPATPTPNEARSRVLGHVREHTIGGSPLGTSSRDWSDSPSGKIATAKDRVKAATAVALSPNGKWVAMGETGYKPRVLIFSNAGDASESPACALAEHSFGVQALSFSSDSRYLASLGTVNDGFLYLWSIDDRTGAAFLHSSNKCTVSISDMKWVGKNLLTVGLRFVKVWRPSEDSVSDSRTNDSPATFGTPRQKTIDFGNSILSPKQSVLAGKNSLLGDLLDCNFVCAVSLGNDKAAICSDNGEVAIVEDVSKTQALRVVASLDFAISTARVDDDGCLLVEGVSGASERVDLNNLAACAPSAKKRDRRQTISPIKAKPADVPTVIATATIANLVLEMDSRRNIRLTRSVEADGASDDVASLQLPAHSDSVVGVDTLSSQTLTSADFFTFTGSGAIRLWGISGSSFASLQVPVESSADMYDQTNELRAAVALTTNIGEYLVAGDRYGTVTMLDLTSGAVATQIRAHSAEIACVATCQRSGVNLVATCGRDRTIQLFVWEHDQLSLIQTLDEHAAAVNGLLIPKDGKRLLSYSQDRTVIVREAVLRDNDDPASVVFVMTRSIALKSSPTSICPTANADEILVSSMDRCVGLYNIKTGQAGFSFKCSDADGGEAVSMSKIAYEPSLNGNPAIIGISSSDKSVRLYTEYGSLIARDWGHTEGITDLVILRGKNASENDESKAVHVVTVAADSTIFVWDTLPPAPLLSEATAETNEAAAATLNTPTPLRPPLRKVLSFSEVSRFKREKSIDEGNESPTHSQRQPSPQRLRKKPSKISIAQTPKLEPAFRGEHSRRRSLRKRSPSPPSPRARNNAGPARKPSLGMTLRSKSSENVLNGVTSPTSTLHTGFGSMTASSESLCRTLRAYRKKLFTSSALETVTPETLRELETELKLLNQALEQRSPTKKVDDEAMAKVLEEASKKIVRRLDEPIKERVEDELRRSTDATATSSAVSSTPHIVSEDGGGGGAADVDAVAGALQRVALGKR